MTTEEPKDPNPSDALNGIKDEAIVLSMAGEYLCEDPYVRKIGFDIEQDIEILREYIASLKERFVGRPSDKIGVDEPLEGITRISELLQKGEDGDFKDRCVNGELGNELGEKLKSLARAIREAEDWVEGRAAPYTKGDIALDAVKRLRFLAHSIVATYSLVVKLIFLLLMVGIITFFFLFITMESEKDLIEKIEERSAHIRSSQAALSQINKDAKEIRRNIAAIEKKRFTRQTEIRLIDLNLQAYKISQDLQKTQIDIGLQSSALEKRRRELEEMKRKSFLDRLLRR